MQGERARGEGGDGYPGEAEGDLLLGGGGLPEGDVEGGLLGLPPVGLTGDLHATNEYSVSLNPSVIRLMVARSSVCS